MSKIIEIQQEEDMGYQFVGGSATESMVTGHFTGRCPLTGRFMSGTEFGDDEPIEHHFGLIFDPTEEVDKDESDDFELWFSDNDRSVDNSNDRYSAMAERFGVPDYGNDDDGRRDAMDYAFDEELALPRSDEGEPPMPAHSHIQHDDFLKSLGWDRDVYSRMFVHGKRGRQKRTARMHKDSRTWARNKRTIDTWLPHERKVEVHVDRGYWSLWDDCLLAEPDVTIDASFGWSTGYVRLVHMTVDQTLLAEWAEYNLLNWGVYQVVADEEDMLEALLDQSIDHYAHHLTYEDSFEDDSYDFYPDYSYMDDDYYDEFEEVERLEAAYWDEMFISPEDIDDMIDRQEEEMEHLFEALPISHSGGGRGVKAVKAARALRLRPHDCFEAV